MKFFIALSTLAASALAAPAVAPRALSEYFYVLSGRGDDQLHLLPLIARDQGIFLGGSPSVTYCPPEVGSGCPPTPGYTVLAGGQGTLGLGVSVPGGQEVYIGPDGALGYTQAHSDSVPKGSVTNVFTRYQESGYTFGVLGTTTGGLSACPTDEVDVYQVYSAIPGALLDERCLQFQAMTYNVSGPGAWQYE